MCDEGWQIFWIFWAEHDPVTKPILWHNLCQHQADCADCHAIAAQGHPALTDCTCREAAQVEAN